MMTVLCSSRGASSVFFLMTVFSSPSRLMIVVSSALTAVTIGAVMTAVAASASRILRIWGPPASDPNTNAPQVRRFPAYGPACDRSAFGRPSIERATMSRPLRGSIDADLGGGLIKQRVAPPRGYCCCSAEMIGAHSPQKCSAAKVVNGAGVDGDTTSACTWCEPLKAGQAGAAFAPTLGSRLFTKFPT